MSEHPRIEDLRRRVQKDPASIAFAQLGEEYRRAGQHKEAVEVCRAGLAIHPGYLSARVTLGRALVELHELEAARAEFETVLRGAPENLAAIRGLAEVFHKSGALTEALTQYRAALTLARNDPDLEQTVAELTRQLTPKKGPLFEGEAGASAPASTPTAPPIPIVEATPPPPPTAPAPVEVTVEQPAPAAPAAKTDETTAPVAPTPAADAPAAAGAAEAQVKQTIEALEQWLDAIHVSRSDRSS
jgi:tetratricopeptide (TPR) repeat protein